jgi:urease accessory protein
MLAAYGGRWQASLDARIERRGDKSQLTYCQHTGPLRLQKALWPEGTNPVHLLMLHPPGGIAAGDTLDIQFNVQDNAHALVTTPGAGKWYKSLENATIDQAAVQSIALFVGADASLEWLPQEVIVHDGALAKSVIDIRLHSTAAMLGSEVIVLGRKASAEVFSSGEFHQSLRMSRGDKLVWSDRAIIRADLIAKTSCLKHYHVSGVLWATAPSQVLGKLLETEIDAAEKLASEILGENGVAGVSKVGPTLFLVRAVGDKPEKIRQALMAVWAMLRPIVVGRPAVMPRIWNT